MIFETHAHYDDERFAEDRRELLTQLPSLGIRKVINVASTIPSIEECIELAQSYNHVYAAVGVHPSELEGMSEDVIEKMRKLAAWEKTVAIGEIGLDYYWDASDHETQKKWFLRQLELAKELDKPVIIHSREAAQDTLDMIRQAGGPDFNMVIHCFSYSTEIAREYLNMGYYLGIGGVVTYKNGRKLKEVVSYMPLDRILLETDAPYLSPVPFRGKRNSSEKIHYVAEEIARLKNVSQEEVLEAAWNNACRFYRLNEDQ